MATLKEILANPKYGDDMVISLADGTTLKVGDVRSYDQEERNAIVQRAKRIEDAESALTQRVTKLRAAGLLDDQMNPVVPTRQEVKTAITSATGIDEDDPLFGPLLKQVNSALDAKMTALQGELEKVTNQVKLIGNVTQQGVKGYLDDHYDRAFHSALSSLPETVRSKVSMKEALDLAEKKKLTDGLGRFDIALAVDQLSWPHVKEAQKKELDGTKNQLEEDKRTLAQIGRPGSSGPKRPDTGFKGVDDKGKTLSLDEALAAAANDSELWNSTAAYLGTVQ